MQRQMSEEPENNTAVVAALSGLLTLAVILQILVLGVLFRRKEIRMFGKYFQITYLISLMNIAGQKIIH